MAVLIAALWLVGQPAYLLGIDASRIDVVLDGVGLGIAIYIARSRHNGDLLTALLFAPMFAVHAAELIGNVTPLDAWRTINDLAFVQIGTMLASNDWGKGQRLVIAGLGIFRRKAFA